MKDEAIKEIIKLLKKKYTFKQISKIDIDNYVIAGNIFGTCNLVWGKKYSVWVPATVSYMIDTSDKRRAW